MKKKVPAVLPT